MADPVTIRGSTTLSRRGNVFTVAAWAWVIVGLVIADFVVTLLVPRAARPGWVTASMLVLAFLPAAVALLAGPVGRFRPFRWLLAEPQPSATIDDVALELCLPAHGCRRFRWEEIGRLVPATLTRREQWTTRYGRFDLCSPEGSTLATVPYSLAFPAGAGLRGTRLTMAEIVVARHPERFALLRPTGPMTPFLTFGLVGEAPPQWEIDAAARRRRMFQWLLIGGLLAFSAIGWIVVYASSRG